ncbi:Cytochrome P450, E-class, group I [Trema orientale]|uniref:Cytochrome P450, E-class, group I n=1 Tax=Trema orientale TaxID=63057 RepID=A0A2P5F8C8_TREOI|nr:Cytochrome P450, E-class, group I [Trema orientale]
MEHLFSSFSALLPFLLFMLMILKIATGKRTKTTNSSTPKLPPGPWKLPVIGNLHQLIGYLPHHRLRDLANKYGPLMHLQLGEVPLVVISSPETAKEIMKTHDVNFAQRPFLLIANKYHSKDIVFSLYGDYWRMLRKICNEELLSPKRVQSFRSIREEEVSNLIGYLRSKKGSPINLSERLFSMTYVITARAAFGKKCKDQEAFISTVNEVLKIAAGFSASEVFPSQKWLLWISGLGPKLEKCVQRVDQTLDNIIDQHNADRAATSKAEKGNADCLLDVLMNLQDKDELSFPLETENIKAVILDVFIGGSETSSTVVEWAMLEMLKNPRVMEKAQAEVRQAFGRHGNVDEAGLHELKFLKLVIKETLRLHPPGPFLIPRESKESCVINGYYIPAKTKVIVNGWAIGRDPRYWAEAEKFYPERFTNSSVDFRGTSFEYIPFGGGRRICPGISFAIADIELPIAQLLFHFDWKLPSGINHKTLDMTESFGMTVRRKIDLYLIPVPWNSATISF